MTVFKRLIDTLHDPSGFSLPEGTALGPTDISLAGREYVEVHGTRGLTAYDEKRICVRIKEGILEIEGEHLTLKTFCGTQIAVCGKISSLHFTVSEERKHSE